jgi:DNA-binding response OmpR family regulator
VFWTSLGQQLTKLSLSVIVTERSIDRCATTLRAKIEPDPHNPTYIQTIRDIGYRFETGE